jgi:hypothetical protein
MVEVRKNRLHFRNRDIAVAVFFGCGGLLVPETSLSGDVSRNLTTFLGLLAASVLPTISLIIGSMNGAGRSVFRINELRDELRQAMTALFWLFGIVAIAVFLLVLIPLKPTSLIGFTGAAAELAWTTMRAGLGYDIALGTIMAAQVPKILLHCLELKHQIAVDEGRRKVDARASSSSTIAEAFPTSPDYGRARAVR